MDHSGQATLGNLKQSNGFKSLYPFPDSKLQHRGLFKHPLQKSTDSSMQDFTRIPNMQTLLSHMWHEATPRFNDPTCEHLPNFGDLSPDHATFGTHTSTIINNLFQNPSTSMYYVYIMLYISVRNIIDS